MSAHPFDDDGNGTCDTCGLPAQNARHNYLQGVLMPKPRSPLWDEPCRIDGCTGSIAWLAEMLCNRHELMMRRTGDPLGTGRKPMPPKPPCVVEGCESQSRWRGMCRPHFEACRKYGDPLIRKVGGVPKGTPQQGRPPKGGIPGYDAAHRRVKRSRGLASAHRCVECAAPAAEWAYTGGDPDELTTDPTVRHEHPGLLYSLDPAMYVPMCVRCHRLKDHCLDHTIERNANGRWGAA